jgi:CubicO group peptidase (beta-lactamase class C family)
VSADPAAELGIPLAVLERTGPLRVFPADLLDSAALLSQVVHPERHRVTSIAEILDRHRTCALLVLHDGVRKVEWYDEGFAPDHLHPLYSVTKSVTGTLAALAIHEGLLERAAPVVRYLPELIGSGFEEATVGQVLDMTVALDYDEDYEDDGKGFGGYLVAIGAEPRHDGQARSLRQYVPTLQGTGQHGWAFQYATPVAEVAGWLVERAFGAPYLDVLTQRLWDRMSPEHDAVLGLDPRGEAIAGGGLATSIRDLARFGQLLCDGGTSGGVEVIPSEVIDALRSGGDTATFARCERYAHQAGYAYGNQWWLPPHSDQALTGWGIHGQLLWVDPVARVVIAAFADSGIADDPRLEDEYDAMCRALIKICTTP